MASDVSYIVENDQRAVDTTNGVVLEPGLDRAHARVVDLCRGGHGWQAPLINDSGTGRQDIWMGWRGGGGAGRPKERKSRAEE